LAKKQETLISEDVQRFLRARDWFVIKTHGNMYQSGLPDLYAAHSIHGSRWIELKRPDQHQFGTRQLEVFAALASKKVGVWVMTAATDSEYSKLFRPPNIGVYVNQLLLHVRSN